MKQIANMNISEIIEEIIAPYIPILLIGNNIKFSINLIVPPNANAITGMFTFPSPCKAPLRKLRADRSG